MGRRPLDVWAGPSSMSKLHAAIPLRPTERHTHRSSISGGHTRGSRRCALRTPIPDLMTISGAKTTRNAHASCMSRVGIDVLFVAAVCTAEGVMGVRTQGEGERRFMGEVEAGRSGGWEKWTLREVEEGRNVSRLLKVEPMSNGGWEKWRVCEINGDAMMHIYIDIRVVWWRHQQNFNQLSSIESYYQIFNIKFSMI